MQFSRIMVVVFVALLLAACRPIVNSELLEHFDTILVSRGIEVYRENYCGSCHTLAVANTRGTFGPNHDAAATIAAEHLSSPNYPGNASTVPAYIRESILNPALFYTPGYEATNHHMPAFTHLTPAEIEAMVYMLSRQG